MAALTAVGHVQCVLPSGKECEEEATGANDVPQDLCRKVACRKEQEEARFTKKVLQIGITVQAVSSREWAGQGVV